MESELEVSLAKAAEEQAQLASEAAHLQWEESRLKTESLRVEHEREVVERARASLMEQMSRVGHREEEANNLNQVGRQELHFLEASCSARTSRPLGSCFGM